MILKVKHEDLNNVNKVMDSDSEILDKEIDSMAEQIEKLRTVWIGGDAKIFCDNFEHYLARMKGIPIALNNMAKFVKKANGGYEENDMKFSKELEKEANNYDEDRLTDN